MSSFFRQSTGELAKIIGGTSKQGREVRILLLGQCLNYGYEGVAPEAAFPQVAAAMLESQLPQLRFRIDLKYLYYPTGLKPLLAHRLPLTKPDLVVINLPAMFAARRWRVNMIYEIAPELVDAARSFMRRVEAKVKGRGSFPPVAETLLDSAFAWRPPISLAEYERLIEEAIRNSRRLSSCRFVLMGPGRFNEDTVERYEVHQPELWSSVNRMVMGLAQRLDAGFINVQEALGECGGEVFNPNNHRFSPYGHLVVAREVANVVAAEVAATSSGK